MKMLIKILISLISIIGIVFILSFLLISGDYKIPKTVSEDQTIPHITINDITFHAETFGDPSNPIVIIVHGGPGWDYKSLLPLRNLANEFYVVFYDQRGAGLSPRVVQETLTLESSIQDLDSIINYYAKGKKVNLIGHSWGAMLVSSYIGQHPDKVNHAVLAEPGFLTAEMAKKADIRFGPKFELGFLLHATKVWFQTLHIKSKDKHASSDYFLGHVAPYANPEYYCNGVVPEVGAEHWRAGSASMKNVLRSAINSQGNIDIDLTKGVEKFSNTVLFVASECSKIGVEHQKMQMKYFPNAELAVVKDSGHMMFGEKPAESVKIVREYLRR